jgi:hypothetical protein
MSASDAPALEEGTKAAGAPRACTHAPTGSQRQGGELSASGESAACARAREMAAARGIVAAVAAAAAVLAALAPPARGVDRSEFPPDFLFGAATSAYQVSARSLARSVPSVPPAPSPPSPLLPLSLAGGAEWHYGGAHGRARGRPL